MCSKCYAIDCIGTCFTHVPACDSVRVESAEQLNASVHALHMFKPATNVFMKLATQPTRLVHALHMSTRVITSVLKVRSPESASAEHAHGTPILVRLSIFAACK